VRTARQRKRLEFLIRIVRESVGKELLIDADVSQVVKDFIDQISGCEDAVGLVGLAIRR
jgi:hypothetical protein